MTESTLSSEHLDPTTEINLDTVKKRAVTGVAILTGRRLFSSVLSTIALGVLWAYLGPGEWGVFLTVQAAVNFLSYFADIGLGAALIQKREKPTKEDYGTVFVTQEILVASVVMILFLISPLLARTHSLTTEGRNLLYALNLAFFLASLKNIPTIILERRLDFGKLAIVSMVEETLYSFSLVFFARSGFGISTFTYSVLLRGVVGVFLIYILQPWRPVFSFSKTAFKGLLKYGVPYQFNSFIATIKDDGLTLVLGGILGPYSLGIFGYAKKIADYPLRFFMDSVNKVTFPAFSRMQDNKVELANALTRSIFFICALVFPSIIGLLLLFPNLISIIPRYEKWSPAYIPLIILSVSTVWSASTTQLTNLLASIGKIKTVVKLMVMWATLSWLLIPLLSKTWGVNGTAIGYSLVASSSIVVLIITRKIVNWSIKDAIGIPLLASSAMAIILSLSKLILTSNNIPNFIVLIAIGALVYCLVLYLLMGEKIVKDVKKIIHEFKKK